MARGRKEEKILYLTREWLGEERRRYCRRGKGYRIWKCNILSRIFYSRDVK